MKEKDRNKNQIAKDNQRETSITNPFNPFKGSKKSNDYKRKPKTNIVDQHQRMPRPQGLTSLCRLYHCAPLKVEELPPDDPNTQSDTEDPIPTIPPKTRKDYKRLINHYLIKLLINNKLYVVYTNEYQQRLFRLCSTDELSDILGLSLPKLMGKVNKIAYQGIEDQEGMRNQARALFFQSQIGALNHGLRGSEWLDTLMALGMARNMPVGIIKEINAAFNMLTGIQKLGLDVAKSMAPQVTSQTNILNTTSGPNTPTKDGQFLDATQAVNLLNHHGQNLIGPAIQDEIYLTEGIGLMPNVIATAKDAQMSIVKNKVFQDHETRRQVEDAVMVEIIPEGPTGQNPNN